MRDEVQLKIERCDERTRASRHALHEAAIAARTFVDSEIQHFAADAHSFVGGRLERIDQPRDFALGILDWLAGLDAQRHGELVLAFAEPRHALFENGPACIGRELAH